MLAHYLQQFFDGYKGPLNIQKLSFDYRQLEGPMAPSITMGDSAYTELEVIAYVWQGGLQRDAHCAGYIHILSLLDISVDRRIPWCGGVVSSLLGVR